MFYNKNTETSTITLTVDAMGDDSGLVVTAPGTAALLKQQRDVWLITIGDEAAIRKALTEADAPMERITIQHAAQVMEMDEAPQSALKNKKDPSICVAINQVKRGSAQAVVSADNTDALMTTAHFVLKTMAGIKRPAMTEFIPSVGDHMALVLDLDVNVGYNADQLTQLAVIGSKFFQALYPGKGRPRVGLSNIGMEDIKGTDAAEQIFKLLRGSKLNFIGNTEGDSVFAGEMDVAVADGSVGNIMLKTIKDAVKLMGSATGGEFQRALFNKLVAVVAIPALKGMKNELGLRKFNGAIFLDLRGIVIKSRGGTGQTGFMYVLEEACREARVVSLSKIEQGMAVQLATLDEACTQEATEDETAGETRQSQH